MCDLTVSEIVNSAKVKPAADSHSHDDRQNTTPTVLFPIVQNEVDTTEFFQAVYLDSALNPFDGPTRPLKIRKKLPPVGQFMYERKTRQADCL